MQCCSRMIHIHSSCFDSRHHIPHKLSYPTTPLSFQQKTYHHSQIDLATDISQFTQIASCSSFFLLPLPFQRRRTGRKKLSRTQITLGYNNYEDLQSFPRSQREESGGEGQDLWSNPILKPQFQSRIHILGRRILETELQNSSCWWRRWKTLTSQACKFFAPKLIDRSCALWIPILTPILFQEFQLLLLLCT